MEAKELNFKFSPELYDQQINWEKRFSTEKDFFFSLFNSNNTKKLLDIGCGTGRHAELFSAFVSEVFAMDPSKEMIDYSREKVIKSKNIKLIHGGFKELANIAEGDFDSITCLGNTLSLLETRKKVKNALKIKKKNIKKNKKTKKKKKIKKKKKNKNNYYIYIIYNKIIYKFYFFFVYF